MATVHGFIRAEDGGPALGTRVQVVDRDMRSEQLLGEVVIEETSGRYEILYTADQFQRAEKQTADLIVRAFADGSLRATSETIFNARDQEQVDLTLGPLREPPGRRDLSELEELQESIEPIRENVEYAAFNDDDVSFLVEEEIRNGDLGGLERRRIRERLEFLRQAAQFDAETGILLAAFYGWFRQGISRNLDELLDTSVDRLGRALVLSIEGNIIPDIRQEIPAILERIRDLRLEEGRLTTHRFVVQLIGVFAHGTERPLGRHLVDVVDLEADAEEQNLGAATTDGRGIVAIDFVLPGDAPEGATRRLGLTIRDEDRTVGVAEVEAIQDQPELVVIRVPIEPDERERVPIRDLSSSELSARLRDRGIETLGDLLANPDITDPEDADGLERLRAEVKWAVLAPDLDADARAHLIDSGIRSPLDMAAIPRAEFVRTHHERLGGDANVYALYKANLDTVHLLEHQVNGAWLKVETSPDDEDDDDPDIPTGVIDTLGAFQKCGCKDCGSAVSPAAYLAQLLDWVLTHVKVGEAPIHFFELTRDLHQPFGDLPTSCAATEDKVRQVRLVVEALWSFTGLRDRTDLQLPTPFRNAYRRLRDQLYRNILINLGTSFEQLRKATLDIQEDGSAAEIVAAQRRSVANILGIDEGQINDLFFNVDLSPGSPTSPTEDHLEQLFGFKSTRAEDVFASPPTPDLITWQRERLEAIWQTQDWSMDEYSGDDRLPFVDPAVIDASYLRTPLDENPAFALLEEREAELAAHRQTLIDADPQENGLADLLEGELDSSIDELRALFASVEESDEPEEIEEAQAAIADLNLTPAGFAHLMEMDARLRVGEPVAATEDGVEAAWATAFDILSRSHRHTLFPDWVEAEQNIDLFFGPKQFWFPVEPAPPPNPWQAAAAERSAWEAALERHNRRPIIDPDLISKNHLVVFAILPMLPFFPLFPSPSYGLWESRREWIDEHLDVLRQSRQGQPSTLDALQAMLEASSLGIALDIFAELTDLEAEGVDLQPRLAQLGFGLPAYRFLADVHLLAEGNANVSLDKWHATEAILVQAEKQREFAEWRGAEQAAGIILHPQRFLIPDPAPPIDDSPHTRWLHDALALRQWVSTLEARNAQFETLNTALAEAVGEAAEVVLPLLRNILIMESNAPGDSLQEKGAWLDERLLMDMFMDGCHMTTRVSHAIETLQRLVRGVYTHEHIEPLQPLTLDAVEDYENQWSVMGSYPTWRAFMLAYLYPENLLHVVPPRFQSFGFARLKGGLRTRIAPAEACVAAEEYGDYFRDVSHLEVQASCQVKTRVVRENGCDGVVSALRSRVHMFARATTSGKVYTASFDGYLESEDTLDTWRPVPKLANVLEVIGAVPHETPAHQRLILLFAKVREKSANTLMVAPYDLDANSWSKPFELDLPPGTGFDFSAVAVQKRVGSPGETFTLGGSGSASQKIVPTILAIRAPDGRIYVRGLNASGTQWSGDDWIPLFGSIIADRFAEVCALIQRNRHEYLMIVRGHDGWLQYRIFSVEPAISRDDGWWRSIAKGDFSGAFVWPGTPDVFVFYESAGKTKFAVIEQTADVLQQGQERQSIVELDRWLRDVVGVSLEDFYIDVWKTWTFHPRPDNDSDHRPLSSIDVEIPFKGSLKELLQLRVSQWAEKDNLPSGFDYVRFTDETYLEALQDEGLRDFKDRLAQIRGFSGNLGDWKLADWYVWQFAAGKGLASAVEDAFNSNPTTFRYRGFITEGRPVGTATTDSWHFVPSGGDEEFGGAPQKAVALHVSDAAFRMKVQRAGDVLSAPALRRVTPNGDGPFDLVPLSGKDDLQLRRAQIKTFYQNLQGAPRSVLAYLKEAYNLVPLYLGYDLQRNGFYEEALLWYRQAYDYLQAIGKRKIDHSLQLEQLLELSYDAAEEWLDDTSNAHGIAATRKNTYTRHVLLMIIRCLIDYADRLYSHDNVTDNARARELYTTALRLLDFSVLKPGSSSCANILGQLEVEVAPGLVPPSQLHMVLAEIRDPDRLRDVVTTLGAISRDTARPSVERLSEIHEVVRSAVAEAPPPPTMAAVLETKRQAYRTLENRYMADARSRPVLQKTPERRRRTHLTSLVAIVDTPEETLLRERTPIPWLREARANGTDNDSAEERIDLVRLNGDGSRRLAVLDEVRIAEPLHSLMATTIEGFTASGISFDFCIPQNPVVTALRRRAVNNLTKLRTCRNIAGMLRSLDPYGAPIGLGSGLVSPDGTLFSGIVERGPTPYRYRSLADRAKELVSVAQQIESGYQTALENAERGAMSTLQAQQTVEQAAARVTLQDLRLNQSNTELGLARLQKDGAILREKTYADWIAAGKNEYENDLLAAYRDAGEAQQIANAARTFGQVAGATAAAIEGAKDSFGASSAFRVAQALAAVAEGTATGFAIEAQTRIQISSFEASFERRQDEWRLQQGLAALDVQIGDQQIQLARDGIAIVGQERAIAGLEHAHAADILEFLLNRTFDEEMYRWIASVLENIYRFFLQEATSVALLAQQQLAFLRQQGQLNVIQSDYWNVATDDSPTTLDVGNVDRLGLTGSARLLKDIYQLDQHAFETLQQKQVLTISLDLAELFPAEFQRFRQNGVLVFETPLSLIDRQLPGYYLCLIQRVSVSIVALVPPTRGIRASLTKTGTSRVVVGGDIFQTVTIRNLPERIALTSPTTTTGVVDLQPEAQSLLQPFEGSGFDTLWELRMPRAANPFDYSTIATVRFDLELTALHSFDYERQVIETLDRRTSADRAFWFRHEFADPWYDLHNPDQTDTPMTVRFETRREDFPPNLDDIRIQHVSMYFITRDEAAESVPIEHLRFTPSGSGGAVGGSAASVGGIISTRRGNGTSWLPMIGQHPFGEWELAFPDTAEVRDRFANEEIEDILLVLTIGGETPPWPE